MITFSQDMGRKYTLLEIFNFLKIQGLMLKTSFIRDAPSFCMVRKKEEGLERKKMGKKRS